MKRITSRTFIVIIIFATLAVLGAVGAAYFLSTHTMPKAWLWPGLVFISVFIYIMAMLAAYLVSRNITKPLSEINKSISSYKKGVFAGKIEVKSKNELGELAGSLNEMILEIEGLNRGLEQRVGEKTKELAQEVIKAEEKSRLLEETKAAMVNVLEDVEEERDKSIVLANDLKKFQLAVENASDQIIITDSDGVVIYMNKSVERTTGFSPDYTVGKKAGTKKLWGGMMEKSFYDKFWHIIKDEKQAFIGEIKNKRINGTVYDAAISVTPILDETKNIRFFVALERDITKAKEIDRTKTEFVSLASHQLRTPLSAINWFTEMLLSEDAGKINAIQKEYLNEVYRGNKRMVDLVNALLNVSRVDLGTFEVEPEPVDVVSISKDVIAEMKKMVAERNIDVIENYDEVPMIMLDPKLIRIIFQNLISNAVKYTPSRGKVEVTVKNIGDNLEIVVSDTGYGIPANQQDKVFTKLFRADNIQAMDTEGTGLGLYIIKSVLDESGGKISFVSKENKGTTFTVVLPMTGMKVKTGSKKLS
jgi:PAS domain S-box-containing protein